MIKGPDRANQFCADACYERCRILPRVSFAYAVLRRRVVRMDHHVSSLHFLPRRWKCLTQSRGVPARQSGYHPCYPHTCHAMHLLKRLLDSPSFEQLHDLLTWLSIGVEDSPISYKYLQNKSKMHPCMLYPVNEHSSITAAILGGVLLASHRSCTGFCSAFSHRLFKQLH